MKYGARICGFLLVALCAAAHSADAPSLADLIAAADNQPISCWVKFVDQTGHRLSNVAVAARIWSGGQGGGVSAIKDLKGIKTDDNGIVHIDGERGGFLRLTVDDPRYTHGFYESNALPGIVFRYSPVGGNGFTAHGSADNPFVCAVWLKEGPQSLLSLSGDMRLDEASEIRVDLMEGKIVDEGGDLLVRVDMEQDAQKRKKSADERGYFPHAVTVKILDGGCVLLDASTSLVDFHAIPGVSATDFPTTELSGQPSLSYQLGKDVKFSGYVRLRGGKLFGKVRIFIGVERFWRSESGRLIIRIDEALFNPSGSRSLEPDPAKLTKLTLTDARKKPETEPKNP